MIKLLDSWLSIVASQEYNVMVRRVDYIVVIWRIAEAIQYIIDLQGDNFTILENSLYDIANKSQNYTLLYLYWLTLILKNTEKTIKKAR